MTSGAGREASSQAPSLLALPFDRGLLRLLPTAVRQPRSAWRSVLVGWATAFLPSVLLAVLTAAGAPHLARPQFGPPGPLLVILLVLFSPLAETLILAGALELLRRVLAPPRAAFASALG